MTGDRKKFTRLEKKKGGTESFGDKAKGKIVGIGVVGSNPSIEDVCLVEGLHYNLLSVSQICDKNRRVIFEPSHCEVQNMHDNKTLFVGKRFGNIYLVDLSDMHNQDICLVSIDNSSWLWHRTCKHAPYF